MVQILCVVLIVLLGGFVFKFFPFNPKHTVYDLALSAFFIVVTLICKRFFTVLIPLFGFESFKIGIEYIPLMIAGTVLAPSYAFVIGLACDLIGLILVPTGYPFFGFTLTMILVSTIPSFISLLKEKSDLLTMAIARILIVLTGVLGSLYIFNLKEISYSQTNYPLNIFTRISLIAIIVVVVSLVLFALHYIKQRINEDELKTFSTWTLSVVSVEIICTLFLTPLWLSLMYKIPFFVSLSLRVVKEVFVLPIEIFIGYLILRVVLKMSKN